MSKQQTLSLALLLLGAFVLLALSPFYVCTGVPLIGVLIFGSLTTYQYMRDWHIINKARTDTTASSMLSPPPAITSPGSTRLFVPPPLERR